MIGLAWRIALRGGLTARGTLAVRALGIGLGAAILLLALGAMGALETRGDRVAWREERTAWSDEYKWRAPVEGGPQYERFLHVVPVEDRYEGELLTRVFVAELPGNSLIPPGLAAAPQPGEVFVSERLRDLIAADPEGLGVRFGPVTGLITDAGLAAPGELVAITGMTDAELPETGLYLPEIPGGRVIPGNSEFLRLLAIIGAVTLLAPVGLFIAAATRLDAQQSEVRLAAMRLAGAAPNDIRRYVVAEATLAIVPGMLLGLGLFLLGRQFAPLISYQGQGFFPADVAFSWSALACLVLIPLLVVGASIWGLRDVEVSPLGVRRGVIDGRVGPWGPVVLAAGVVSFVAALRMESTQGLATLGVAGGMLLIVVGLATTGPWLGRYGVLAVAGLVRSPALLLAFRRIAVDARSSFRTVAGVSLAVFLGTFFLTVADAAERETTGAVPDSGILPGVLVVHVDDGLITLSPDIDTVTLNYVTFATAEGFDPRTGDVMGSFGTAFVGTCAELARALAVTDCGDEPLLAMRGSIWAPGLDIVVPRADDFRDFEALQLPEQVGTFAVPERAWSAPDVIVAPEVWSASQVGQYWPKRSAAIPAPGEDIEVLRSRIIQEMPMARVLTGSEEFDSGNSSVQEVRQLVHMGILAAFIISGATGAISVAGSLIARRVPFSLLRLTGCPLGVLRRAVIAEAIVPLLLVSLLSVAVGLLCGLMTIAYAGSGPVEAPASVVLPLLAGLALGLGLMAPVLPLIERVTRSSHTRFD